MKILFVVEHFYPYVGGAEELFLNLAVSLAKEGYEINVITTLHDKSLQKYEEYNGIKITRINCYNRFLFTLISIPHLIRKAKLADFIHTTSYNSAFASFVAGIITRKKVIITFHEVWGKLWFKLPFSSRFKLTCFYLFEQFILKLKFNKYIAVSEFTKNELISNGIPSDKIVLIYNGVNYEQLKTHHHHAPTNFTFCFFGRLGLSKGIDLLLEGSQLFFKKYPTAKLKLIIPTYPKSLFSKVLKSIDKNILKDNLILLHNLDKENLIREVTTSSCVIIPSLSEGFCYVAVESVAMGIPVISSNKGALSEVVGGKYLNLKKLNAKEITHILESAIANKWDYKTPPKFTRQDSIEKYLTFYKNLKSKSEL